MTAGNWISFIGPKLVSTLILVGLDLYRNKNVAIRAMAHMKQTIGTITQNAIVNRFPLGSLTCFNPKL